MMEVSRMLADSGYFQDAKDAAQAFVKVLAGKEIGFPSFASMTGIHIIKGKPTLGANLMAAAVKRSPKYDYQVNKLDDKICELCFFENGKEIGNSKFDLDDAKRAGTQNISKYPKNMLFARAISNGIKFFCPDLFLGAPVYTPEELGAEVDGGGEIITVEAKTVEAPQETKPRKLNPKQQSQLHARMGAIGLPSKQHHDIATATLSRKITSFSQLDVDDAAAVFGSSENLMAGLVKLDGDKFVETVDNQTNKVESSNENN